MLYVFCTNYIKNSFLLFVSFLFITNLFSQQVSQGCFNGWDYSPNGVFGNLRLTCILGRTYYKIEKEDEQNVMVQQINPSGIVTNTTMVVFKKGILTSLTEISQWGEKYEYKTFTKVNDNEFIVTDLEHGENFYFPCKYARVFYSNDLLTEERYYSFKDQLMDNTYGYAIVRYKRYCDSIRFAEKLEMSFYNLKDLPVTSHSRDCHKTKSEFDIHDNKILETFYGDNDEAITSQKFMKSIVKYAYDENNNLVKTEYYNLNGSLALNIYGFAVYENQYINGYKVKEIGYDSLHNITSGFAITTMGAIVKSEYDSSGNRIKISYFDKNENPVKSSIGVHETVSIFNARNMLIEKSYFDTSGNPFLNRDGAHKDIYTRDEMGRISTLSSYDSAGDPIKTYIDRVFMLKYKYDEFSRKTETSFWKDSITSMPNWNGYYKAKTKFNEQGLILEFSYYDRDDAPFICLDGASMERYFYNEEGNVGECQFLHNNNPITIKNLITSGYSIMKYGYNENGFINEITFLDEDSKPVNAKINMREPFNACRIKFIYSSNKVIEQIFYEIGNDTAFKRINCLENDYISVTGKSIGRKKGN